MKEVLRKLGLVANWLCFGGIGVFCAILGFTESYMFFGVSLVLFIVGFVVQKIINWVFE